MAKKARKKLKAAPSINLQAQTTRTLYATWAATNFKNQSGYKVVWEYSTGQGVWFSGSETTVTGTNATYSAPSNAVVGGVRVGVAPNPGNKAKWVGTKLWTVYRGNYGEEETTPAAPSQVDLSIDNTTITVTILNYSDEKSNDILSIQIIEDDGSIAFQSDSVKNEFGRAELVCPDLAKLGGHRYKARALAFGRNGEQSEWSSYTQNVYSAPNAPTISTIRALEDDILDISWSAMEGAESYTLQYTFVTVDGVPVFDTGSSDVQEVSGITATHYPASSLTPGETWYFRLKAVGNGGEESEWSEISSSPVGVKPEVPTVWCYTTNGKIGEDIIFNWTHNSADGSDQTGARLGIKINDGEEQIINLTTENFYAYDTSSLSDSDKINWRVSTKGIEGIDEEWSDYSEYREIFVYLPAVISLTVGEPDAEELYPVVEQFPIDISWVVQPVTQSPISFSVSIVANEQYDSVQGDGHEVHVNRNAEIYSTYILANGSEETLTLQPGDLYLVGGITYTITVTAAMSNGLITETSAVFLAKWDAPEWTPDADIYVDPGSLVGFIRPFCADENDEEYHSGFNLGVYRVDFDGNLTEIKTGISASENVTITDMHPSLDYARYRIVAIDLATGASFYTDPEPIPVNARCAVIQWDGETKSFMADPDDYEFLVDDWSGTILKLPYNVDVSDDISPDVSLIEYAGRNHPVSYYGTQQGSTSRWSVEVPKSDIDTISKIRQLAIYPGDVYVREETGTGYWANVKVSYSVSHNKPTIPVTFTITRVEGGA